MFLDELEQIESRVRNLRLSHKRRLEDSFSTKEDNEDHANPSPIVQADSLDELITCNRNERRRVLSSRKRKTKNANR
jgi:hypothetical protein